MSSALIGFTGFVGSSLLRQRQFDALFNSTSIGNLAQNRYSLIVCAGAPAQKWIANRDPEADRVRLLSLMQAIREVECQRFVLVSTVDVYLNPFGVDEDVPADETGLHAYGRHRLEIERLVASRFEDHLIVRLPGLVGPGLRKNAIYDLHHGNNTGAVDSRGVYQFYPMVKLWPDIETTLGASVKLVHLTAEPVSVAEVARDGFGQPFVNELSGAAPRYDFRSRYAAMFGGLGSYQYSKRESLLAIRAFAQSELRRTKEP